MHPPSDDLAPQNRRPLWKRFWFWLTLPCVLVPVAIAILMLWPGWEFKVGDDQSSFGLRRSNGSDGSCITFFLRDGPFCVLRLESRGADVVTPGTVGWRWEGGMARWIGSSRSVVAAGWPEKIEVMWETFDLLEHLLSYPATPPPP